MREQFFVIPDQTGSKFVLCERKYHGPDNYIVCHGCRNLVSFENIKNVNDTDRIKESYCIHAKLCEILFVSSQKEKRCGFFTEILMDDKKLKISLVHPSEEHQKIPGIVIINTSTTKPKSHTYKGFKCLRINLLNMKDVERKTADTEKVENPLDPRDKSGAASNVFRIKINYPPSEEEKKEIRKINNDKFFERKFLFPSVQKGKKCECGYKFQPKPSIGNVESYKVYVHHSKPIDDSRTSSLMVLYLGTGHCKCKIYYTGEEDKLLRVSGISLKESRRSHEPVHLISYDFLFEYHTSVLNGGVPQNVFVGAKNDLNTMIRGCETQISRQIFRKGYEIFLHSLQYDKEKAWMCQECPQELNPGDKKREEDFKDVEVHISDGIDMGTIQNTIKGFVGREIFEEEKVNDPIVKGINASERTFLAKKSERDSVKRLSDEQMSKTRLVSEISKIKKQRQKSKNFILVQKLMERLQYANFCDGYRLFLSELGKCSPIAILLPSYDSVDYRILEAFLSKEYNIFEDFDTMNKITNAFPVIVKVIRKILESENTEFLPNDVSEIIFSLIELRKSYNETARSRAAPRVNPGPKFKEAEAAIFPNLPVHTMNNRYSADAKMDETDDISCNKEYNESPSITGGITHITCKHSITKGFTAMHRGESPLMIIDPLLRRFPKRVQARQRFLIYDNACMARKCAEVRFPHKVRHWTFVVDRKHWDNHTACSIGFNMDEYSALNDVNSQISEQLNRSLRKLSTVLAYMGWENYLKLIELFMVYKNLKNKNLLV